LEPLPLASRLPAGMVAPGGAEDGAAVTDETPSGSTCHSSDEGHRVPCQGMEWGVYGDSGRFQAPCVGRADLHRGRGDRFANAHPSVMSSARRFTRNQQEHVSAM
jgi:hypothetical protein